jgi:aminomethyltransferase
MSRTALADKLAAQEAKIGEYGGAETAASFGDTAGEISALLQEAGVYDLGWRGKLIVTGEDRARWLNGMVTNNIKDLSLNQGNYNFVLSTQGRIQGDAYIYNRGEYLLVDTDQDQIEKLSQIFNHYIIMDDVEVTDASGKLTGVGIAGPQAASVLAAAGFSVPEQALTVTDQSWREAGISIVRPNPAAEAFEIWTAPNNAASIWEALVSAGSRPVGTEALEKLRILSGVPRYGQDIKDRELPQETEQTRALNFSKGCYLGQEIVERIRSRGIVHRTFVGLELEQEAEPGSKIEAGGKEMGYLTSVTRLPKDGGERVLGLGYLRREVAVPGTAVKVGESAGQVSKLPFEI